VRENRVPSGHEIPRDDVTLAGCDEQRSSPRQARTGSAKTFVEPALLVGNLYARRETNDQPLLRRRSAVFDSDRAPPWGNRLIEGKTGVGQSDPAGDTRVSGRARGTGAHRLRVEDAEHPLVHVLHTIYSRVPAENEVVAGRKSQREIARIARHHRRWPRSKSQPIRRRPAARSPRKEIRRGPSCSQTIERRVVRLRATIDKSKPHNAGRQTQRRLERIIPCDEANDGRGSRSATLRSGRRSSDS